MSNATRDTIYALSSGRPPAAISVVRISGPRAGVALKTLIGRIPDPRQAALARVRGRDGEIVDQALALWFPGPRSETGEDVAELQLHGGHAVIAAVIAALGRIEGLRLAEPGEFTRRAFENGQLDLTQVEALADLVSAETQAQRRQAFQQLRGLLGNRAELWRRRVIEAQALVEAGIDFSDEGDVPQGLVTRALRIVGPLAAEITQAVAGAGRGERLREGLCVAIAGPPNAGKSTLLNRIAGREAAIVSPYAGTTRDLIEVHLDLGGLPVTFLDTAGIRETEDPVELEGVRRARERANSADLVLWMVEEGEGATSPLAALPAAEKPAVTAPIWIVRNKIDLVQRNERQSQSNGRNESTRRVNKPLTDMVNERLAGMNEFGFSPNELTFDLSAKSGEGFDALLEQLTKHAETYLEGAEAALVTRERHRRTLEDVVAALQRASRVDPDREDLLAEELRIAAQSLGRLTGRVDVEDVLDVIFRDFCIGK